MNLQSWTTAAFALLTLLALQQHASAQGMGGGGQSPTGSNLTSGLGFGNAAFSNGGMGGMGGGGMGGAGGGMGAGGMGGMGGGQGLGGQGGGMGATGFGTGGQQQGAFIGRDSSEVTAMFEAMGRQGQQANNRSQRGNQNSNRGRDANEGADSIQQQVRVKLRIGFEVPDAATSPMATALTQRLAKVLEERAISDFDFTVNSGNVIVTGVAKDDFEQMLVSQLLSQQPGVLTVTNQMTVAEAIAVPTPQE
ncbi:hypothetical protein [Aeoliella sp. SH292]|uniref:hypothetical protein n=1 Tax=Aeoliella sp. SH292 TaxID=3454464 RepID=UPI003F953EE4